MANRPLRFKILMVLLLLNAFLTYQKIIPPQRYAEAFPEVSFWIYLAYFLFFTAFLILFAALWLRIKIAYVIALLYIVSCLIFYFVAYPNYPAFFFILESIQLVLLLSLFNYYFGKP
jgi:hypothetical protein